MATLTLKSKAYDGRYLQLDVKSTSNGSAKNSSTVAWTLKTVGGDSNYSTGPTKVIINGTTVYTKSRVAWDDDVFPAASGSTSGSVVVPHRADGTKSIAVRFSTAIYTSAESEYSGTLTLDPIPRYGTVSHSLNSKTETSIKMNWSSDSTVDYIWYSKDDGSNWTGVNVTDGKSGTYTISGLSANTTYKIKTRIRRKDSQLTTDSSALSVTTYNYPYCISAPNFVIGNEVTLKFYNPLNRTFDFTVTGNGSEIYTWTDKSGTSYKGLDGEPASTNFYNSIPNAKKARYKVTVKYGTSQKTHEGGYYSINEKACTPTFSTFTYKDSQTTTANITGNNQVLVKGLSQLTVDIAAANKMVAKNGATPSRYVISIDTLSRSVSYTANAISQSVGVVSSAGVKRLSVRAYDSRGLSVLAYKDITVVDYAKPVINGTLKRLNNFENETTLSISGTYSRVVVGSADKNTVQSVQYRYREKGGTWPSSYTTATHTASSGKITCPSIKLDLDNSKAYEFEIKVNDKLGTNTATATVPVGQPIFRICTSTGKVYNNDKFLTTYDDVPTLKTYINIADNTDLNTIRTIGTYKSTSQAHTDTMANVPSSITGGFRMVVSNWTGGEGYTTLLRQDIYFCDRRYVRFTNNSGVWLAWKQVALLENIYPVGSVYISSTNTNPATTLGVGSWTLIDKGFASSTDSGNTFFTAAENCVNEGTHVIRGGNTIRIRQAIKTELAMEDATHLLLGYLDWDAIGIKELNSGLFGAMAYSDGANGGIVCNITYDTGAITQVDTFDLATVPSDKTFYLDFTVVSTYTLMIDSFCNKFYWKRTR
jgi:hypothetical protein